MSKNRITISLPERFDFDYHREFNQAYHAAIENDATDEIVLNFSQVKYLDSSALGMMVLLHREASAKNIATKMMGARGTAQEILDIANMQKLYESA